MKKEIYYADIQTTRTYTVTRHSSIRKNRSTACSLFFVKQVIIL